jgi:transposase
MDIMAAKLGAPRRRHSPELKTAVIEECRRPGASVAAIALAHELNANLVHHWLRKAAAGAQAAVDIKSGFIEVRAAAAPVSLPPAPAMTPTPALRDIRIELRRGATTISVAWPAEVAEQCGAWLGELLR